MDLPPLFLQSVASLVAIFGLFILAKWMGLGGNPKLENGKDITRAADEVEAGFEAARWSISKEGKAALLQDETGRIMLIRRHGNRFAGRVLTSSAKVREVVDGLLVDPSEPMFGELRLTLNDASFWADAINRL